MGRLRYLTFMVLMLALPNSSAMTARTRAAITTYRELYQSIRATQRLPSAETLLEQVARFAAQSPTEREFTEFLAATIYNPELRFVESRGLLGQRAELPFKYVVSWVEQALRTPAPREHTFWIQPQVMQNSRWEADEWFRRAPLPSLTRLTQVLLSVSWSTEAIQNLASLPRAEQEIAVLTVNWGLRLSRALNERGRSPADRALESALITHIQALLPGITRWQAIDRGEIDNFDFVQPLDFSYVRWRLGEAWQSFAEVWLGRHHFRNRFIGPGYDHREILALWDRTERTQPRDYYRAWSTWIASLGSSRPILPPDLIEYYRQQPDHLEELLSTDPAIRYLAALHALTDYPGRRESRFLPDIHNILAAAPELTIEQFEEFIPAFARLFGELARDMRPRHDREVSWLPWDGVGRDNRPSQHLKLSDAFDTPTRVRLLMQLQDELLNQIRQTGPLTPELIDNLFTSALFHPEVYLQLVRFNEVAMLRYGLRYIEFMEAARPPQRVISPAPIGLIRELRAAAWLSSHSIDVTRVFLRRWIRDPERRRQEKISFQSLARVSDLTLYTRGFAVHLALMADRYWNASIVDLLNAVADLPAEVIGSTLLNEPMTLSGAWDRTTAIYLPWMPQPEGSVWSFGAWSDALKQRGLSLDQRSPIEPWLISNQRLHAIARLKAGIPSPTDAGIVFDGDAASLHQVLSYLDAWSLERPGLRSIALQALRAHRRTILPYLSSGDQSRYSEALRLLEAEPNCTASSIQAAEFTIRMTR